MSPLSATQREGFAGIAVFDYDPNFRFEVGLTPVTGKPVSVDLGTDGKLEFSAIARTDGLGNALGNELTLYWIGGYGGGLFLPFRDATSGAQTYGGGRYLIDTIKGADLGLTSAGRLILDFNFAYYPSCAISDDYVCPLSPPDNLSSTAINAGERLPLHAL